MKSLRLGVVEDFPFLQAPSGRAIADGYQLLHELGAVDDTNSLIGETAGDQHRDRADDGGAHGAPVGVVLGAGLRLPLRGVVHVGQELAGWLFGAIAPARGHQRGGEPEGQHGAGSQVGARGGVLGGHGGIAARVHSITWAGLMDAGS